MLRSYKSLLAFLILMMVGGMAYAEPSEIVLQTIAMESANQSARGQEAVAGVILERSRQSGKPLEAVCLAPRQFSCWNSPKEANRWLLRHYDSQTRGRAVKAYHEAKNRILAYRGIRHYHAKGVMPKWAKGHTPAFVIGEHLFYRGIT